MILEKLFIKDYNNTTSKAVRYKYGLVAGVFGIITNLLLFASKIIIGLLSASITIIADAINNLSDVGSSVVILLGFKLSSKPADSKHPYGHERYEHIMALIVSMIVMAIGILLAKSSIEKMISPETVTISLITYIILILAILTKLLQMLVYRNFAKKIDSNMLHASSMDSRNDIISTSAVLLAMIIINVVGNIGFSIDGLFGLMVSIFIMVSSCKLIRDTINPLLGEKQDDSFVQSLKDKILSYEGVLGLHDLMIHSYGANTYFVTAHVEVSSKEDIMLAHELMDTIERDFKNDLGISLSVHMDPIDTTDPLVRHNREKVEKIISEIDDRLSIHDFRTVIGKAHINLVFDVDMPYDCNLTIEDITAILQSKYKDEKKKYYFVMTIDRY
ncbi:MAG: cation transporter [Clostridiales bacterium]|nr:cation transporter [Clostridiales bacterium]